MTRTNKKDSWLDKINGYSRTSFVTLLHVSMEVKFARLNFLEFSFIRKIFFKYNFKFLRLTVQSWKKTFDVNENSEKSLNCINFRSFPFQSKIISIKISFYSKSFSHAVLDILFIKDILYVKGIDMKWRIIAVKKEDFVHWCKMQLKW